MAEHRVIPLRPAQRKHVEQLVKQFEAAKAALDNFMGFVVEDLAVPEGWVLNDLNVGFMPAPKPHETGQPNPYKAPAADAVEEARPFA